MLSISLRRFHGGVTKARLLSPVAQSVERWIYDWKYPGSNPGCKSLCMNTYIAYKWKRHKTGGRISHALVF